MFHRTVQRLTLPTLAAGAAAALVLGTQPALAHHPVIEGRATCQSGTYVVDWTVGNSESYRTMTIVAASADRGVLSGLTPGTILAKRGQSGDEVTGVSRVAAPASGYVTLSVTGRWTNGVVATRTGKVGLSGSCVAPTTTTATPATTTTARPATTTTARPTTTTAAPTTTTAAPTTTARPTTTTAGPPTTVAGPTTTVAGPTTTAGGPTTTAPEPTTTTGPEPTVSSVPTTSVVPGETVTTAAAQVLGEQFAQPAPSVAGEHLARTGQETEPLFFFAVFLFGAGLLATAYARIKTAGRTEGGEG